MTHRWIQVLKHYKLEPEVGQKNGGKMETLQNTMTL